MDHDQDSRRALSCLLVAHHALALALLSERDRNPTNQGLEADASRHGVSEIDEALAALGRSRMRKWNGRFRCPLDRRKSED